MGRNGKRVAALAGLALAAVLTACGSSGGYTYAYVVGEAYCPGNPFATCVVMSDGDIVGPVGQSELASILYGMVLSPYSGGYRFTRQPSSVTTVRYARITHVAAATAYAGRSPVSPAAEVSEEKSGDTYNAGGKSYPKSPAYQRKQAAARASVAASRAAASRYAAQQREPQDDVPSGSVRRQVTKPRAARVPSRPH